jgi:Plasmid pRiA4b ORF-3-like protein
MPARKAYVFHAELLDAEGVARTFALSEGQTLERLHEVLNFEFGWDDDHLYSFWLDGEFWGDPSKEFTRPVELEDTDARSSRVRLKTLELEQGQQIAYIFDFGDEWRVLLTVHDIVEAEGTYPRVIERVGAAPPQYEPVDQ